MDEFEKELAQAAEQGSKIWFDIRAGRFTSSKMHELVKSGSRLMTPAELKARPKSGKGSSSKYIEDPSCLAKGTETYIRSRVAETLTGQAAADVFSHATSWGDEWEPVAAEQFKLRTGLDFEIVSFVPYGDHAGGSPDRLIKGTKEILEIKCPYNSANQIDYLMLTDQWDLKANYPEHYWQCMANILFLDAPCCHFVTYDPRMQEEKNQMFYLKIKPIEEDIDLIILKLESGIKEKLRILNILRNQKPTLKP